jgi:hypothetical protein
MKTTIESYQNQTKKENKRIKLRISFATRRIFKNLMSQEIKKNHQVRRLITLKFFSILLTERKKITFDKFLQNKNRLENRISKHDNTISIKPITKVSQTEINTLNELIPVTPTATQNKSNLERIKTQINQSFKKISRNTLIFKYACFLRTIKKITSKELLLISYINKEKIDLLTRVHSLLVLEHARLNKVAKAS